MERFCDKCGTLVNSDGGFCPMCGASMPAVVDLRKPTAGGNMPEAGSSGANSGGLGTADYRIDDDPLGLRKGSDNANNQNNMPTYVESSYNGSYNSSDNNSGSYNGSYNGSNNYNNGSYNGGNSGSGCGCSDGFAAAPGEVTVNMSTLQWVGTILLGSCLGIISIIILIYWAFGGTTAQPKKNYARAALAIQVAGFVLSFVMILMMFMLLGADFWESIPY